MGDLLICPKCRERLWVGEMQIPLLTCPRCLARVVNPNVARESAVRPRQVIEIEEQADEDVRGPTYWLNFLAIALIAGAVFVAIGVNELNILSVLMAFAGVIIGGVVVLMYRIAAGRQEAAQPYLRRVQRGGTTVFDYASIGQQDGSGAFLSGFMLALSISFVTLIAVAFGRGVNRGVAIGAGVVGLGALVYLAIRAAQFEKRGFLNGLVVGIVISACSCGPCALIAVSA